VILNTCYTGFTCTTGAPDPRIDDIIEFTAEVGMVVTRKHRIDSIVGKDRVERVRLPIGGGFYPVRLVEECEGVSSTPVLFEITLEPLDLIARQDAA